MTNTFQQSERIGNNSNDTQQQLVYENMVLSQAALDANFVFVEWAKSARFRIIPQLLNGEVAIALDPNGQPEEYTNWKKEKKFSYRHMIGGWMQRCDIMGVYHNRQVTTLCTDVRGSEDGDTVKGGSPASVICDKVKWKAREQWYRNKQGIPFDETVPKHWIRWMDLDPERGNIIQAQGDKPDMRKFPFPSTNFMVQTLFWEKDGEALSGQVDANGAAIPAANVIFCMPSSGWKKFEIDICKRKKTNEALTPSNCHFGDFISEDAGQVLTTYKVDKTTYAVGIDYDAGICPLTVDQIAQWWRPWEELINVMTYEESIRELGKAMGEETVGYGLAGSAYEKWCPEEWLEKGRQIQRSYNKQEIEALLNTGIVGSQAATPQVGQAPAAQTTHQAGPVTTAPATTVDPNQQIPGLEQQTQRPNIQLPPQQSAGLPPQQEEAQQQTPQQAPVTGVANVANVANVSTRPPMESAEELKAKATSNTVVMPESVANADATQKVDEAQMSNALDNFKNNQGS